MLFITLTSMKAATLAQLKKELNRLSHSELLQLTLRLGRFKKENKELLTYLVFMGDDEEEFKNLVKQKITNDFQDITATNYYYIKKTIRKILRETKKYIRYSGNKETEIELLLYFCEQLVKIKPSIYKNQTLTNLYERQIDYIKRKIPNLHEDLQYDFEQEIKRLI